MTRKYFIFNDNSNSLFNKLSYFNIIKILILTANIRWTSSNILFFSWHILTCMDFIFTILYTDHHSFWWIYHGIYMYIVKKMIIHIEMSRIVTKPTKWHVRPAKTQISMGICLVWSESSLYAQWVAKDPSFLHADSEDSDQTGQMPRLIRVFAGCTWHFVGFVMRRLKYPWHSFTQIQLFYSQKITEQKWQTQNSW